MPIRDTTDIVGRNPFAGATVANMNPALADELGLEGNEAGVTITRIRRDTIAASLQFQPGDVILKVNGHAVTSVADLRVVLTGAAPQWSLVIRRGGKAITLNVGG
jgi:serine protease Do